MVDHVKRQMHTQDEQSLGKQLDCHGVFEKELRNEVLECENQQRAKNAIDHLILHRLFEGGLDHSSIIESYELGDEYSSKAARPEADLVNCELVKYPTYRQENPKRPVNAQTDFLVWELEGENVKNLQPQVLDEKVEGKR